MTKEGEESRSPELPPELRKFLEEQPAAALLGLAAAALLILTQPPGTPPAWVKGLPPLGGRRNSAWRGKGSFGKAPFGSQVAHRR